MACERLRSFTTLLHARLESIFRRGAKSKYQSIRELPVLEASRGGIDLILVRSDPARSAHVDKQWMVTSCQRAVRREHETNSARATEKLASRNG